jgi:[ribosomal protein S5]-alanine N-acetyltransferase
MIMTEELKPWFPIRTERLLLRPFTQGDFDAVHAYANDDAVIRFMDWGPNTLEETQAALDRFSETNLRQTLADVNLAIHHVEVGTVIGSIRLSVNNETTRTGDFGYALASAYWRCGLGTEAARAMLRAGFEDLGLRRIWAECDTRNIGSWGIMQKLGMRREAHFWQDKRSRDGWRDSYLYAILADEWREGNNIRV